MKESKNFPKYLIFLIITVALYITCQGYGSAMAASTGTVSANVANVRSSANTNASVTGSALKGTNVVILAQNGEWYQVQCGQVLGWMHQSVLTIGGNIPSTSNTSTAPPNLVPGITLDGQVMSFDVPPMMENDRILVPMAAIFRAMGAIVTWDEPTQTVTAVRGSTRVILPIDSYTPTVNGVVWKLDVPARVVNNRTLAPLRFVGEALGGTVVWDAINYTAKLTSPPPVKGNDQPVVAVNTGTNTVNLRSGPDTGYGIVDTANPGETLKVLGQQGDWYLVSRGARNAWLAGWVVALIRQGEDIPAAAEPPTVDPSGGDNNINPPGIDPGKHGITIATQRTADGIKITMDSDSKLTPDINKSSGQISYSYDGFSIVGTTSLQEKLGSSSVTIQGSTQGDVAQVQISYPAWVQYQTSTENNGMRQVILIRNCITSVTRKTFGSGGESIGITTTGTLKYNSTTTDTKLIVVMNNAAIGTAQTSYNFASPLISSLSFNAQNGGTTMIITTKQATKFAVGTTADGCGLTVMFIDKKQLQSATSLVVLDPGHGGYDPGASGDTLKEKDTNLAVVQKVGKLLTAKGIKVAYTRQDDTYVGLDERSDLANLYNAALFVSVHCNASTNSAATGTETYCYYPESDPQLYLQKEERYNLALKIQQAMVATVGTTDRGVKQGNLSVLRKSDMPSALVEMAFISNTTEEAKLASSQFRDKAAQAIADAISSYMKAYVK